MRIIVSLILLIFAFSFSVLAFDVEQNMDTHCKGKWTKRGVLDRGMFNYCVTQQREAVYNLKQKRDDWEGEMWRGQVWFKPVWDLCFGKWTKRGIVDLSMVDYCMTQQHEGILDINYILKTNAGLENIFKNCSRKWGIDISMIAYCLKSEAGLE